jgi:uncharacterized protein YyaL (SSP411 family)
VSAGSRRAWVGFALCALAGTLRAQDAAPVTPDDGLFASAAVTLLAAGDGAAGAARSASGVPSFADLDLLVRLQQRLPAQRERLAARCRAWWDALERGALHERATGVFDVGARDQQGSDPAVGQRLAYQTGFLDLFLDAWLLTGEDRYRAAAGGIVGFLRARLLLPDGAFAAATSAAAEPEGRAFAGENALAIGALARAALVLDDGRALALALGAAEALRAVQWQAGTGLAHAGWGGPDAMPATAFDHACVVQGLLRLHQAGGGLRWLALAVAVQDAADARCWREEAGSYQDLAGGAEAAGGDALAARNLLALAALTDDDRWRARAQRLLATLRARAGAALDPALLAALDSADGEAAHLLIVGDPAAVDTRALLAVAHAALRPRLHVLVLDDPPVVAVLRQRFPAIVAMPRDHGAATAYLCLPQRCLPAVTSPQKLAQQLAQVVDGR